MMIGGPQLWCFFLRGYPEELSVKGAVRAIRDEITRLKPIPEKSLCLRLAAVKDNGSRRRNKQSRNYPRKKKRRKPP